MAKAAKNAARTTLRFLLDGTLIELDDVEPTLTVLEFLRERLRRTGTKEGCAEGDCGACTVAIVELDDAGKDVRVQAVNSCIQFLPTLDGKELITVESLAGGGSDLHPVQRAMVDCHASQCGFCTPGFVMSLFVLYKTQPAPGRVDIDDALAGNLCRCTGYRPIIAAAEAMYAHADDDDWLRQPAGRQPPPAERIARLRALDDDAMLHLQSNGREFYAPTSAAELATVLAEHPDATLLGGGTDVGLWVTKQHQELDTVIYVGRVRELRGIEVTDGHIEIGAGVTFSDAMPALIEHLPALEELLLRFASPPIRNTATIGGNVANGSPIGDSMPALMVLDSTLVLRSAKGRRELPLSSFYKDYRVNALAAGEFLEAIRIPRPPADATLACYKVSKRFDQDISAVCAAFLLRLDGDKVASACVAFGGMAATIRSAPNCEKSLTGKAWNERTVEAGMRALAKDFEPIDDMRATADYRLRVAQNLLKRLYLDSRGEIDGNVYSYGRTS